MGRGRRGGCFKNSIPHSESFTLEEESEQGGSGRRGNKGPPPQPPVFTNNRHQFPSTEPSWHSEKTSPLPRQINAKRNNSSANIYGSRGSGDEQSDKHVEKNNNRARIVAVAFSMHTLCARGTMKPEINAAVGFLSRFLRVKGHVNDRQVQTFSQSLQDILAGKKSKKNSPLMPPKHQLDIPQNVNNTL